MLTSLVSDRTLKGIGVLNTAPTYEPLPNFERYESRSLHNPLASKELD